MSYKEPERYKGSEEQADEHAVEAESEAGPKVEDRFAEDVVDETPEFEPSFEQEINTKVETDHPETVVGREDNEFSHLPLAQEERIRGREEELERISAKATFGTQDGREERTREVVVEQRREVRCERHVGVRYDSDPREDMEQADIAEVNTQAARISERVRGGSSRAALSRRLSEKVAGGQAVTEAVFEIIDEEKAQAGTIVPIAEVGDVQTSEVDIEGEVIELWDTSNSKIQQVGLIADESGKTKFTVWERSFQPMVREGQAVRLRGVKKNWYEGRCSVAVTGWSRIVFPERDRWWNQ